MIPLQPHYPPQNQSIRQAKTCDPGRGDQHLKTLRKALSRAGLNNQPIIVRIHKLWTNQKSDILALSLSKSDSLASFIFDSQPGDYYKY